MQDKAKKKRWLYKRAKGLCHYCKRHTNLSRKPHPLQATIDHRIPASKGGTLAYENIVLACQECNKAKADQLPWDFQVADPHTR